MSQAITLHEINRGAFNVLYKELGLAKTLRFLNQFSSLKGDYTQLKVKLFNAKTVEDIVQEMRKKIAIGLYLRAFTLKQTLSHSNEFSQDEGVWIIRSTAPQKIGDTDFTYSLQIK